MKKNNGNDSDKKYNEYLEFTLNREKDGYVITRINQDQIKEDNFSIVISDTYKNLPVLEIDDEAFEDCSSLTSITIPSSMISIGAYAFCNCSFLSFIFIPNSVDSIGEHAFEGCNILTIYTEARRKQSDWSSNWNATNRPVYFKVKKEEIFCQNDIYYLIKNENVIVTGHKENITEVVIPSTIVINGTTLKVTIIGNKAFDGCSSVTSIEIPNGVTTIGYSAFKGCNSLESITIPFVGTKLNGTDNAYFGYIFGASSYYNAECVPSSLKEVIIIGGTSIGDYAFQYCRSLTIYCEASSQPSGWNYYWNSSNRPVYWAGEWSYVNGVPTPNK